MFGEKKTQTPAQGAASTVALENLAESIARGTLRALDERQLATDAANKVTLPIGDGTTVLGIVIPPWRKCPPGEIDFGLYGCQHVIMGIIIMHPPGKPGNLDEDPTLQVGESTRF